MSRKKTTDITEIDPQVLLAALDAQNWPDFIKPDDIIERCGIPPKFGGQRITLWIQYGALPPYDVPQKSKLKGWFREGFLEFFRHKKRKEAEASLRRMTKTLRGAGEIRRENVGVDPFGGVG